jgi:hypothetical protein
MITFETLGPSLHYYDLFFGLYPSSLCFAEGSPDDEGRAIPRNVVVEKHRDHG